MRSFSGKERRRHERYETDVKVEFYVNFDLKTKVDFCVEEKVRSGALSRKYSAISRNVSAEGIAFESTKDLIPGDRIYMEVYIPKAKTPVHMEGEVRWCQPMRDPIEGKKVVFYDTGVKILFVENNSVEKSLVIDKENSILWSIVLESIFGTFKHLMLKTKAK